MNLTFFSDPARLHHVNRGLLTRLLEDFKHALPREAAARLAAPSDFDEWCSFWAAQFSANDALGAPLLEALVEIETLSLPEHAALLEEALTHLPPGYEVNRGFPPLNQALHLWLIAQNTPGVVIPLRNAECGVRNPALRNGECGVPSDAGSTVSVGAPDHSAIRNPQSALERNFH